MTASSNLVPGSLITIPRWDMWDLGMDDRWTSLGPRRGEILVILSVEASTFDNVIVLPGERVCVGNDVVVHGRVIVRGRRFARCLDPAGHIITLLASSHDVKGIRIVG